MATELGSDLEKDRKPAGPAGQSGVASWPEWGVQAGEPPLRINPLRLPKGQGLVFQVRGPLRLCIQRPRWGHWAAWEKHAGVTLTPASVL